MVIRGVRFNLILWFAVLSVLGLLAVSSACSTAESRRKKVVSAVRFHLEAIPNRADPTKEIEVFRSSPTRMTVTESPFISEGLMEAAKLVDLPGGFGLQFKFEKRGAWLLEQYTGANRGKRVAIYAEWNPDPEDPKRIEHRWLGAPKIARTIQDGIFEFTPDASREEAEAIVLGINNLAKQVAD
jgi:hypothetical protein